MGPSALHLGLAVAHVRSQTGNGAASRVPPFPPVPATWCAELDADWLHCRLHERLVRLLLGP